MDQGSGEPAAAQVLGDHDERGDPAERARAGTTLCGWTLERTLGGGPVCETWLAGRTGSKSAVVRILRAPFADHASTRADWVGASWAVSRFYHPRVPRMLFDGVDDDGRPVVIRGWARGTPLDQVVRSGGLDPRLVVRIAEQLLDALETAHAHGVVHGALSPANVIVTERGGVRLVDFATLPGLTARPTDELFEARALLSAYVAPERRPSEHSDVWSVGACLHFALAGAPPSPGVALRAIAPDADPALVQVVERSLAAQPLDRYESAYAMLSDIRSVSAGNHPSLLPSVSVLPSAPADQVLVQIPPLAPLPGGMGLERPPAQVDAPEAPFANDIEPGTDAAFAAATAGLRRSGAMQVPPSEWRGNLLLFAAIAVIVGVAAWVMIHVRETDHRAPPAPAESATGEGTPS
ncbi:MAG TPA: serine/threonine-protein kinase [Polyangiaceae bacterium]|jgi:serine/threonine-protein kinase|nr:serine/threonine-protein kinase [Polyangiaceae bacterium]